VAQWTRAFNKILDKWGISGIWFQSINA
jgi:hypothetical protein